MSITKVDYKYWKGFQMSITNVDYKCWLQMSITKVDYKYWKGFQMLITNFIKVSKCWLQINKHIWLTLLGFYKLALRVPNTRHSHTCAITISKQTKTHIKQNTTIRTKKRKKRKKENLVFTKHVRSRILIKTCVVSDLRPTVVAFHLSVKAGFHL